MKVTSIKCLNILETTVTHRYAWSPRGKTLNLTLLKFFF